MRLWFKKATGAGSAGTAVADTAEPDVITELEAADEETEAALDATPPPVPSSTPAPPPSAPPPVASRPSSRALFRQVLDSQYDAVLITDVKGHIVNTNRRTHELFGFGADETWDLHVSRLIPGITDTMIQQLLAGLSRERYIMVVGRCTPKETDSFTGEIAISEITLTQDGNLLFCIRNIDRRYQAQQRLQSARRLLDHIPTPSISCDRDGNIRVVSMSLARLLGHEKPDTLVNQPFSSIWNEPRAAEVIARVLNGEKIKEPALLTSQHGKPLQMIITIAPELDARNRVVGFLAFFTSAGVVSLNNR